MTFEGQVVLLNLCATDLVITCPFKFISIAYSESDQKNVFLSGKSGQTRARLLAADRVGFSTLSIHRNSTFGTIWTQ